jgi:hypothetical protein
VWKKTSIHCPKETENCLAIESDLLTFNIDVKSKGWIFETELTSIDKHCRHCEEIAWLFKEKFKRIEEFFDL